MSTRKNDLDLIGLLADVEDHAANALTWMVSLTGNLLGFWHKAFYSTGDIDHQRSALVTTGDTVDVFAFTLYKLEQIDRVWIIEGLLEKLPQVKSAVGSLKYPSTSNAVECFFGAFERFYRLKGPFCDKKSANKHIGLFMLAYMFRMGLQGQASPLERAGIDVSGIPFYHLINRPNLLKLKILIADQYKNNQVVDHYKKAA